MELNSRNQLFEAEIQIVKYEKSFRLTFVKYGRKVESPAVKT